MAAETELERRSRAKRLSDEEERRARDLEEERHDREVKLAGEEGERRAETAATFQAIAVHFAALNGSTKDNALAVAAVGDELAKLRIEITYLTSALKAKAEASISSRKFVLTMIGLFIAIASLYVASGK